MNLEECIEELHKLNDSELMNALQRVLENRKMPSWVGAADDYGYPTTEAKLAVIRHLVCS